VEAMNDPRVPDPAPYAVTGTQRQVLTEVSGHRRRVLAATGRDDMIVAGGDGAGAWWLETRTAGRPARRFPVSGPDVSWTTTPDGRRALAVSAARGARAGKAVWFTRTPAGWAPAGTATAKVPGTAGCVAPDGSRALVFGFGQPALLDRSGRARPVTDLVHGGACAWSAEFGLVAELAFDLGGARRSRLRAVDRSGAVVWARDLPVEVRPFADPSGPAVGYVENGTLHELDLTRGPRIATVPGVRAARYDGHGSLVTVGDAGTVQWRPGAPAS
jgi:hypothetical protein